MFLFYKKEILKVLEGPGIASKVLEKSWNFETKSPGIFLVGTMYVNGCKWFSVNR